MHRSHSSVHRRPTRGAGFFDDLASGFKKGFTSVVEPFVSHALPVVGDLAIRKLAGGGVRRPRRKLTGEAYKRALRNLAKARAARRAHSHGHALGTGAHYRKKLRSRATTAARHRRTGIRRHTRGAGFLDDVLGTVGSISKAVAPVLAPIAVGALAKRVASGGSRMPNFKLQSTSSGYPVMAVGQGRRHPRTRGGSLKSSLLSASKTFGKDILLPVALRAGKKYLVPKLKERYPWLSHLGLGRRKAAAGRGLFLPGGM